jgi:hypothetical protein
MQNRASRSEDLEGKSQQTDCSAGSNQEEGRREKWGGEAIQLSCCFTAVFPIFIQFTLNCILHTLYSKLWPTLK